MHGQFGPPEGNPGPTQPDAIAFSTEYQRTDLNHGSADPSSTEYAQFGGSLNDRPDKKSGGALGSLLTFARFMTSTGGTPTRDQSGYVGDERTGYFGHNSLTHQPSAHEQTGSEIVHFGEDQYEEDDHEIDYSRRPGEVHHPPQTNEFGSHGQVPDK